MSGTLAAYVGLTKPRVIQLLLVTTVPAMIVAAGGLPHPLLLGATLLGGTLAAASANTINSYLERDIDARMRRTAHRPLVEHRVEPQARCGSGSSSASSPSSGSPSRSTCSPPRSRSRPSSSTCSSTPSA